jgi:uncharacterized phiE125 gp8 family phage protein
MLKIKLVTPPQTEPVTLDQLKSQLRFDLSDDSMNGTLSPILLAAREWCEGFQNRAYITQTLELALDQWPCRNEIQLPRPPLQSLTSIKYTNHESVEVTWQSTNYIVDDYSQPAELVKGRNISWPSVCLTAVNGIKIQYVAGYADAAKVPAKTKQAIILLASHWFENGQCEPPEAVKSLLWMDRVVPL